MKIERQLSWIGSEDFAQFNPLHCVIVGFRVAKIIKNNKSVEDRIIEIKLPDGKIKQMSVWGNNQNVLINKFGDDSDQWINKTIALKAFVNPQTGKENKVIE